MRLARGDSRERARFAPALSRGGAATAGFTIAELLIALLLTGILMITVFAAMDSQRSSYVASEQASDIGQNLRVAVEAVTREVRLAGLRNQGGQPAIVQAAPFQLAFYADVNQSCLCGASGIRIAEDQCWGYETSLGGGIDAAPANCGLKATNPMGDAPNGVSFYGTTVPDAPATSPSHAELVTWTFDRPGDAVTPGDAYHTFTITTAEEVLVSNDCATAAINANDIDTAISSCTTVADPTTCQNPLYNLYRVVATNRTSAVSTDNATSVAKVASGLRGPCRADGTTDAAELTDELADPTNRVWPAFSYWIDRDEDGEVNNDCDGSLAATEDALFGDTNGDCLFSAAELAALGAVPESSVAAPPADKEILENIVRVDVRLTGAAQDRARLGTTVGGADVDFRARHLASSANVRSRVR